jgi:hypothetical protein
MTEYTEVVALQSLKRKIEKWSKVIKQHYAETRYGDGYYECTYNDDSREVHYNDGSVKKTESPHTFEELVRMYEQDHGEEW